MALLPPSTDYTGPTVDQGNKKTFVAAMRTFVADLLGTDSGNKAAARAALGAATVDSSPIYTTTNTATAYALTPAPAITAYAAGQSFWVNFHLASGLNPTLQISGMATPPSLVMQQADGTYINVVGIPANHRSLVTLISATQALVVTMPPTALSRQIQPITASVAANALTVTVNPTTLDFRSATLTSGAVNTRTLSAAASVVVPSTATLGTISAVQSRIVVLLLDNAGTLETAVVNIAGGNDLSETGIISTTAISAAANSANVIYSTTARTNVAYRVVGYVQSTQATAGTWAAAPSTIQGVGGQSAISTAVNAAGASPLYACRAWVNFDGATGTIRASGNVASVTRNAIGDYTVTFTTAMQDANYAVVLSGQGDTAASNNGYATLFPNTAGVQSQTASTVRLRGVNGANAVAEMTVVTVAIFR